MNNLRAFSVFIVVNVCRKERFVLLDSVKLSSILNDLKMTKKFQIILIIAQN